MTAKGFINPEYVEEPTRMNVKKGLEGAVVDITRISKVSPETNSLIYRGYPVDQLADQCRFEEVAYLLWKGELPTASQLAEFEQQERRLRSLPEALKKIIDLMPLSSHPMDVLRTAISFLGQWDPEPLDVSKFPEKSLHLWAVAPTIVAAFYRRQKGLPFLEPRQDLGFAPNFLYMLQGQVPPDGVIKAFDASLTLYAEHSFNASTFAARVIASTETDIYGAVVGAIGALKGPLHGGANEAVMHTFLEIGDPAKAADWVKTALSQKRKIMGFGHRVYKWGDSRVPTMKKHLKALVDLTGQHWIWQMYHEMEKVMVETKGIHPNLDFPAGPAYYLMGIDIPYFTPIFVLARLTGWTAHILEQRADNRLIRPLSEYQGMPQRNVVPLAARK